MSGCLSTRRVTDWARMKTPASTPIPVPVPIAGLLMELPRLGRGYYSSPAVAGEILGARHGLIQHPDPAIRTYLFQNRYLVKPATYSAGAGHRLPVAVGRPTF